MDFWIDLALGPMFTIAAAVFVLGLGYRFIALLVQLVQAWRRAGDPRVPVGDVARATLGWVVPRRLLSQRPVAGVASVLFHFGVVLVPIFLAGHAALLFGGIPAWWPVMPAVLADVLTLLAVAAALVLFIGRVGSRTARHLTRVSDLVLLVAIVVVLLSGFFSVHAAVAPFSARTMVLIHALAGNLLLIAIPVSTVAHCVLFPLSQLVFQLGWHFPAASGRHVAQALGKENEPV
jgi:nitrate reductase gamma subunit